MTADAAGEVAALQAEVDRLLADYSALLVRTEHLKSENQRLADLGAKVQNARGDAETRAAKDRAEADSLRATLGEVAAKCDEADRIPGRLMRRNATDAFQSYVSVDDLRAILSDDPASLADVWEVCTCDQAEVEDGTCVLCGKPFPVGGAV